MKEQEPYIKYCLECGAPIVTAIRTTQEVCSDCRRKQSKLLRSALEIGQKSKPKKKKHTAETQSVYDFVAEVERYNKKHGTRLSYGQYELKRFLGQI